MEKRHLLPGVSPEVPPPLVVFASRRVIRRARVFAAHVYLGPVLYVHGGPTGQHFRWWDPIPQLLANRGLVVLAPNVRGSTGYGREWQELNRRDWGGGDLADVMAGVDWLIREDIADRLHLHNPG